MVDALGPMFGPRRHAPTGSVRSLRETSVSPGVRQTSALPPKVWWFCEPMGRFTEAGSLASDEWTEALAGCPGCADKFRWMGTTPTSSRASSSSAGPGIPATHPAYGSCRPNPLALGQLFRCLMRPIKSALTTIFLSIAVPSRRQTSEARMALKLTRNFASPRRSR